MSSVKTTVWGLKYGHPTPYRRTLSVGKGKKAGRVLMVFQPDTPYELTDEELAGCQDLVKIGLLVPWETDPKGRRARPRPAADQSGETDSATALQAKVSELELELAAANQQVALLIEQVKSLGGEPVVEAVEEDETTISTQTD